MFEPLTYFDDRDFIQSRKAVVKEVPIKRNERRTRLGTPFGMLVNEVQHAPDGVVEPLLELGYRIVSMCRGDYDSSFVDLLLFVMRLLCKVERFVVFVQHTPHLKPTVTAREALEKLLARIRTFNMGPLRKTLLRFVVQAENAKDVPAATKFHAHHAMMFANHVAEAITEVTCTVPVLRTLVSHGLLFCLFLVCATLRSLQSVLSRVPPTSWHGTAKAQSSPRTMKAMVALTSLSRPLPTAACATSGSRVAPC